MGIVQANMLSDRMQHRHRRVEEPRPRPVLPSWRLFADDGTA